MERLNTGIIDLDEKMQGGFVKRSVNLVTGKTGTGKTAFCASFLYAGAQKNEPGVYVTTEEPEEDIKDDIKSMFNWNIDELEKNKLIQFLVLEPVIPVQFDREEEMSRILKIYVYDLYSKIEELVKKVKAKRVVIDSTTIIEMFIKDDY
ncbi:MAG: AAA family ATPase, partial [Candidatus Aenigmarchaeota archaeon]|nr:AAA family ATPase [Candidatus Aenigmarchaeota archaeon]